MITAMHGNRAQLNIDLSILHRIGDIAAERASHAYVVGGYVRDTLLGRPTKDIDISVVGDGIALAHAVRERLH
ncbi:MAG TPA: hypothetical protein PK916_14475, partial [Bacteroidota bacterium]|nr:hypothetical protein [Bacteroidota bacterium]